MLWQGLETACYNLMHIAHFLKDTDQLQSHSLVWCHFICVISIVEISMDRLIVVLPLQNLLIDVILQSLKCLPYVSTITVALVISFRK